MSEHNQVSLKKNIFFNTALTLANYIFPLIVFPYISRVLGVEYIGRCNFIDSIVNYFILFSMLGVNVVGVREIAQANTKNNSISIQKHFSSLFALNLIVTLFVLLIYILLVLYFEPFKEYSKLLYIGAAKILFTAFLLEWFYKGVESFKYITIRSVLIRCVYVILVFLLIKKQDDYILYYFLTVGIVVLNAVVNVIFSKRKLSFSFNDVSFSPYVFSVVKNGVYAMLTSMYTTFNIVYLGFVSTDEEVGYYATALKIYTIILAFYGAFTEVMLPRISALFANNERKMIKKMINQSFDYLFMFSIPVVCITFVLAPQIIFFLAGEGYEKAILPMRLIMPLIIVVGAAQIYVRQLLIPMRKDNFILYNSIIGAIIGIIFNIALVNNYASLGSAAVILVSEIAVTTTALIFSCRIVKISFPFTRFFIHILYSIPYVIISLLCVTLFDTQVFVLFLALALSFLYFVFIQVVLNKNSFLMKLICLRKEN